MRLWEVSTGRCLRVFQGHTNAVVSVSLSTNSHWALSGSWDGTMRLWEVSTGCCLRVFQGHTKGVYSVSLSIDGNLALLGGYDETMQLWELDWELEAHSPAEWDEKARSYLESFLRAHSPGKNWLGRWQRPQWEEPDFQYLVRQLQYVGYGWLRPEGVRRKLEELAATWQGPSPFTSTQDMAD